MPRWAKDTKAAARAINARAETVATLPTFRDAFACRRCLIPADGFYEWQAGATPKAPKQLYSIAAADGGMLALAGLWESWRAPDSGEVARSFAIVTTAANDALRHLHQRMPVMLPREAWPAWLGEAEGDGEVLLSGGLTPALATWPVAPRVRRVAENDAGLARPSVALAG